MSELHTPETDAELSALNRYCKDDDILGELADFARKLERERNEAREQLAEWQNSAAHVEEDHPDEAHCGCVPTLRKLLNDARRERDEARGELARIEELLMDGEADSVTGSVYKDWNALLKAERDEALLKVQFWFERAREENRRLGETSELAKEANRYIQVLENLIDAEGLKLAKQMFDSQSQKDVCNPN